MVGHIRNFCVGPLPFGDIFVRADPTAAEHRLVHSMDRTTITRFKCPGYSLSPSDHIENYVAPFRRIADEQANRFSVREEPI